MSKQFDPKNKSNFIEKPEDLAKELFGYDDEALLRELKEAELELEQMKADNPELEKQIQQETEAGFEALMQKIHDENIKPVTELEYSKKKMEEERKVTRLRPILKGVFVAAAILAVLSGMGGVVSARKGFEYQLTNRGKVKNEMVWQNGDYEKDSGQLEQAYNNIKDELGIDVIVLGYKPLEMEFENVIVDKDKGHARIMFRYENRIIYLKETKNPVDKVVETVVSDRKNAEVIYNPWLSNEFIIEQNELEENLIEYSTKFDKDGAYYYFGGVIDKNEFVKIVEGLTFLQD